MWNVNTPLFTFDILNKFTNGVDKCMVFDNLLVPQGIHVEHSIFLPDFASQMHTHINICGLMTMSTLP